MLININAPVSLKITRLTDLPKLRTFMEQNSLKLNRSEIARQLKVDRRTVAKYLDGFEKSKHRNSHSKLDKYHDTMSAAFIIPPLTTFAGAKLPKPFPCIVPVLLY